MVFVPAPSPRHVIPSLGCLEWLSAKNSNIRVEREIGCANPSACPTSMPQNERMRLGNQRYMPNKAYANRLTLLR